MTGPVRDPARRALLAAGLLALPGFAGCGQAGPTGSGSGPPRASDTRTDPPGVTDQTGIADGAGQTTSTTTAAPPRTAAGSGAAGPDITHGPTGSKGVALTFHGAGDAALLTRMLAALVQGGAKVTVLAIGQWLAGEPTMARQILDGGHELGNHTWSHQTMPRLASPKARSEVDRAAVELRRLTGSRGRWFRPSGTPHSTPVIRAAAVAAGYGACLAYDVDPMDHADPGPGAVLRRFGAGVRAGSIVSLHLGHRGTVEAMPAMLDLLRARGLTAVTASELLART